MFSSLMGSSAAKKQAEAQRYAADQAKALAKQSRNIAWGQFKEGQANYIDPVVGRGTQAGNSLLELITSGGKTMGGKTSPISCRKATSSSSNRTSGNAISIGS